MSEHLRTPLTGKSKKRRSHNACDWCRQRKIRCDSATAVDNICSQCITFKVECTHNDVVTRMKQNISRVRIYRGYDEQCRGRWEDIYDAPKNQVDDSESTKSLVAAILSKTYVVPHESTAVYQVLTNLASRIRDLEEQLASHQSGSLNTDGPSSQTLAGDSSTDTSISQSHAQAVSLSDSSRDSAQKSNSDVITQLVNLVHQVSLDAPHDDINTCDENGRTALFWSITPLSFREESGKPEPSDSPKCLFLRRPEFWVSHPWKTLTVDPPPLLHFPDDDLIPILVDLYFQNVNDFLPILHRPSFEKAVLEDLHHRQHTFGALLLGVCAIGSRYSSDPRVYTDGSNSGFSVGWKYFRQIKLCWWSWYKPPTLNELQLYLICIAFLFDITAEACWRLLGMAIRLSQEVGVHRRRAYSSKLTVDQELWKRAFWILVLVDHQFSRCYSMPRAMRPEDHDLDLPVECDDEYWVHEDPEQAFKQPAGKPCRTSHFIQQVKMMQILEMKSMRSISASEYIVEADSALDTWMNNLPSHLRIRSPEEDRFFFEQSVSLHALFFLEKIHIHRSVIVTSYRASSLCTEFLGTCVDAARSFANVLNMHNGKAYMTMPYLHLATFSAAVTLLLNIRHCKRSGQKLDLGKEVEHVWDLVGVLACFESRMLRAGRLNDIILDLISKTCDNFAERFQAQSQGPAETNVTIDTPLPAPAIPSSFTTEFMNSDPHMEAHSLPPSNSNVINFDLGSTLSAADYQALLSLLQAYPSLDQGSPWTEAPNSITDQLDPHNSMW